MNLPQLAQIMQDFERESEMMGMKEEVMGEVMDGIDEEEGEDEEGEVILNQVRIFSFLS